MTLKGVHCKNGNIMCVYTERREFFLHYLYSLKCVLFNGAVIYNDIGPYASMLKQSFELDLEGKIIKA